MKTVGKQLQEARLAKNWTPELAARETKIKVDRLRDLETDDYSHFTSPTYARGFVRTYARSLGLDEYKILRQLDNKLPDDDSANIVTDTGVAYLPETAMPPRAAHRDYTGYYIVMGLGGVVMLIAAFVLLEAYRVGELSSFFDKGTSPVVTTPASGTNADGTPATAPADAVARALPVDSNTPPPIAETPPAANTNTDSTATAPRALPVDPGVVASAPLNAAAPTTDAPIHSVRALPVDPSEMNNSAPATAVTPPAPEKAPPRALPVDPSELNATPSPATPPATTVALNNVPPDSAPPVTPSVTPASSAPSPTARLSNSNPVVQPSLPPIEPSTTTPAPVASTDSSAGDKRLVLTASQDSFVKVTDLDAGQGDKPLYASVLHSGQSIGFDGRKFSINVGIPSAVDIKLDGVNYGPHSDKGNPETFNVESHLP
jgi:cytoskeleton protein RodZ